MFVDGSADSVSQTQTLKGSWNLSRSSFADFILKGESISLIVYIKKIPEINEQCVTLTLKCKHQATRQENVTNHLRLIRSDQTPVGGSGGILPSRFYCDFHIQTKHSGAF